MGVRTTADDKLDEVIDNINDAYKNIMVVIDPNTWGSEEFKSEYLFKLEEIAIKLARIKRDLK